MPPRSPFDTHIITLGFLLLAAFIFTGSYYVALYAPRLWLALICCVGAGVVYGGTYQCVKLWRIK